MADKPIPISRCLPQGAIAFHLHGGRPKQMGPASLPTPLSPMRGHFRRSELGIRCFAVVLRRGADVRVRHRRSHRHPDPPSGGFFESDRGRSRLFPREPALIGQLRGRIPPAGPSSGCASSSPKTFRNAPIGRRPDDPARFGRPSHFLHHALSVRPKPSARSHSRCARTAPSTPSRFEFFPAIRGLALQAGKGSRPGPMV